jgi:hypothetical protein
MRAPIAVAPLLALAVSLNAQGNQLMQPWLARGGDDARSGWNGQEQRLTQDLIKSQGVRLAVKVPVYGDAMGMEAQPLIVPAVATASGTHDLMLLPSEANVIRGVDAQTGMPIWNDITLPGMPVKSTLQIDSHITNDHFGCISTGVVDADTDRLYQSCWISTDGTPNTARFKMFVVDIAKGILVTPKGVDLQGNDSSWWKQRSSLALIKQGGQKTVLLAHGSVFESGGGDKGFTGGIVAFDTATNTVVATMPMTSGIWMAGAAPPCNSTGDCYYITGNGDFDPSHGWFGESFVRVHFDPAAKKLSVVDWWSPWTDLQRSGQQRVPEGKVAGMSMPSEQPRPVGGSMSMPLKNLRPVAVQDERGNFSVNLVVPPMASGAWSDEDWGSAGPACFFKLNVCLAAGKDGIAYGISTTSAGKTTPTQVGTKANCKKLAIQPFFATASAGSIDTCPADLKTLNIFPQGGYTVHEHGQPIQFYDPKLQSDVMVLGGENSRVHKWAITASTAKYIAEGHEFASEWLQGRPHGGMPGSMCTGSSNKEQSENSYIVVCTIPYGDANAQRQTPGHIVIYDPIHITADGFMPTLWDSGWFGAQDPKSEWHMSFNKFDPPVINGGEIIVPTFDGRVLILL